MTHDRPGTSRAARRTPRTFDWNVTTVDRRAQRPHDDAIDGSSSDLSGCGGVRPPIGKPRKPVPGR